MGPDSSLTPELIQAQTFTDKFRGYDQAEVRTFLNRVATELRAWQERAEQLESAWHSAEERAARPPVLDEDTLMAAVGEETASILRSARAAATDMRTKAAEEAEKVMADARAEAQRLQEEARTALERATATAEESAGRILATARAEADEVLDKVRAEAEAARAQAEKDRQLTIEGANATRDRILEDLARRRRVATVQIEQLRAGRERLIESYAVVRRTLEEAQAELSRADSEARAAADEVGRRLSHEKEVELSESSHQLGVAPVVEAAPLVTEPVTGPAAESVHEAGAGPVGEVSVDAVGEAAGETVVEAPPSGSGDSPLAGIAGSAVDELFARIKATRVEIERPAAEPAEPRADDAPADDAPADEPPAAEAPTEPPAAEEPPAAGPAAEEPPAPGAAAEEQAAEEQPAGADEAEKPVASQDQPTPQAAAPEQAGESAEETDGQPVSDGEESLFQRREAAIVDLEVTLTRRLKRALQDEQNDVLDRLRNVRGEATAAKLLPAADEQISGYAVASKPLLEQAAQAGLDFARRLARGHESHGHGHEGDGNGAVVEVDVEDLARDAGVGIVAALRRRLEQAISLGRNEDQAVLIESLGAAYREWKTQRVERLAGDVLAAAFARGTWEGVPEGARLRWIVEDIDGPCPDCDDDALAGDLPKGEAFPTGQHHPPAHSGCRCLLVPMTAVD